MPDPFVKPPRLWKRLLLGAVIVITASAATTVAAAFNELDQVVHALDRTPAPALGNALTPIGPGAPETILLMGSDKRASGAIDASNPPHTDTMMLMRIDPSQSSIALLSIPRDLKVRIDAPGGAITGKINAAYSIGGPKLAIETVSRTLGIPVNHLVDTNFGGFKQAVDYLGCVWVDVDRHYFNDNSGPQQYATINVSAGYQQLCGSDALDYVRYRHTDSDFVRVARQQDFVREVKDQIGSSKLLSKRGHLVDIFGGSTETDIHSSKEVLRIGELLALAAGHSIRQVHFPATAGPSYVTATPAQIQQAVHDLIGPQAPPKPSAPARAPAPSHGGGGQPPAFEQDPVGGQLAARNLLFQAFPVYYPTVLIPGATYDQSSRTYTLTEHRRVHSAYRLVVRMASPGDYYGVEGMDWLNPPILAHPSEHRTIGGRDFELFYSGSRLRLVSWRAGNAVYWISNSLLQTLSERQMLALAASTRPA